MPRTLEEAAPHMKSSIKVSRDQELGIYFESYGTNPAGEDEEAGAIEEVARMAEEWFLKYLSDWRLGE